MKMVSLILSFTLFLASILANAQQQSQHPIDRMRQYVRGQYEGSVRQLRQQNCFTPAIVSEKRKFIRGLSEQLEQLAPATTYRYADEAQVALKNAQDVLQFAEADCENKMNNTPLLYQMYMLHVDAALMVLRYGVGSDLLKQVQ